MNEQSDYIVKDIIAAESIQDNSGKKNIELIPVHTENLNASQFPADSETLSHNSDGDIKTKNSISHQAELYILNSENEKPELRNPIVEIMDSAPDPMNFKGKLFKINKLIKMMNKIQKRSKKKF